MNIGPISLFSVDQPWNSLFHPFYSILCMHMHFQRCRVECYWMSCALNPQQTVCNSAPDCVPWCAQTCQTTGGDKLPVAYAVDRPLGPGARLESSRCPWPPWLRWFWARPVGTLGPKWAPETCHGSLWHLKDTWKTWRDRIKTERQSVSWLLSVHINHICADQSCYKQKMY